MPTDQPRIQVTLDTAINAQLSALAAEQSCSRSSLAADLIREALELREDYALSKLADARLKKTKKWLSHHDVWGD